MIVVRHFLKWIETARVSERVAAAAALARAYLDHDLDFEERCAAEAALTLLLDDPSSKVRAALSEALSMSHRAPPQIVAALASDQPDVAAFVLARSPLLADADLIDRAAAGSDATQKLVARRPQVSMQVSAAIAEVGEAEACLALLGNSGARIAALSFRRIVERHGADPAIREALIADRRLPSECRHMLLQRVSEALKENPLVLALIGSTRAEKITRDACVKSSITLIDGTETREYAALVEHLRIRGDLTTGFIARIVANGKIDFFGTVLVVLTGQAEPRIRALLSSGRDAALRALFLKAGLKKATHAPLIRAVRVWREVANGKRVAGAQEVSWLMLREIAATPAQAGPAPEHAELAGLLKAIHLDALRENARQEALAIAAA